MVRTRKHGKAHGREREVLAVMLVKDQGIYGNINLRILL